MTETAQTAPVGAGIALPTARALSLRMAGLVAMLAGLGWMLADRLAGLDPAAVMAGLAAVPGWAVAAALVTTLASHAALSGYDLVAMRQLGLRVPIRAALVGGFAATTVGQVLGLGLVTGSLARWRLHRGRGMGAGLAVATSALVATGFFCGLGVLVLGLTLIDPRLGARVLGLSQATVQAGAALALVILAGLAWASTGRARHLRLGRHRLRLPQAGWLGLCTVLAAGDLVCAAATLWLVLPADLAPPLTQMVAIYAVALALGHVSGAPGGLGAFEAVLLLALPDVPVSTLAAAVLAYRVLYFGPPFALALAILARAGGSPAETPGIVPDAVRHILDTGTRAEAALAWLGDKHFHLSPCGTAFVMYGVQGRDWVVLGDPHGPRSAWDALADSLATQARARRARLAIYKTDAAGFWRDRGFWIQPLGEEATLDPGRFTLDGADRRELRRKVGQARKAGVTIQRHDPGEAPIDTLAAVAEAWRASKPRGEQTFSMGHFDPAYLAQHRVLTAWAGDRCVAFLSLWVSGQGNEWSVDLMRQGAGTPHGTMQALIVEAIAAAGAAGAQSFNLCMAPLSGLERLAPVTALSRLGALVFARADRLHGLQGLRRFKEQFRPEWHPRHLAAASPWAALWALGAIHRLVHAPKPHRAADRRRWGAVQSIPGTTRRDAA